MRFCHADNMVTLILSRRKCTRFRINKKWNCAPLPVIRKSFNFFVVVVLRFLSVKGGKFNFTQGHREYPMGWYLEINMCCINVRNYQ